MPTPLAEGLENSFAPQMIFLWPPARGVGKSPVGGHISRIKLVSLCLKKAMVDAARLADELRAEQDHASAQASSKQSLNNQLGQLEGRLADAENAAAKGGKAAMSKLENKIPELEAELAGTQARTGEAGKAYQRAERKCKELVFSSGEDKKNQDRMTDLASKLQSKIKTYKQQIEEAEEIAALNLAKFRKAQQELEEVEERAKLAALL